MTIQARAVLKNLKKLTNYSEAEICFMYGEDRFSLREGDAEYNYSKYAKEINGILDMLEQEGCIIRSGYDFHLTQKALHSVQIAWATIKSFLFINIAVPIVVSLITTLVTLQFQGLLL